MSLRGASAAGWAEAGRRLDGGECRKNVAHITQLRPYHGLDFLVPSKHVRCSLFGEGALILLRDKLKLTVSLRGASAAGWAEAGRRLGAGRARNDSIEIWNVGIRVEGQRVMVYGVWCVVCGVWFRIRFQGWGQAASGTTPPRSAD